MHIGGRVLTRDEVERRIGSVAQIGGARAGELTEGRGRGMRTVEIDSGAGLRFTVLPDRGMDISRASHRGTGLVYLDASAEAHPGYFDPAGNEWLRGFYGGLLTTCGLTYLGNPGPDGDEPLGLHGRIAHTPATAVADLSGWEGDEYVVRIRGTLEERVLYGDSLRLERTISVVLGTNRIRLVDVVTNTGYRVSPFVILYHVNPGFPLLDTGAELLLDAVTTETYDGAAVTDPSAWRRFEPPRIEAPEVDYLHRLRPDAAGRAHAALVNGALGEGGVGLSLSFGTGTLPYLSEWKHLNDGSYVAAIEPTNTPVRHRAELRRRGELPLIEPGASRRMDLEIGVLDGAAQIASFRRRLAPGVLDRRTAEG